VKRVNPSPLFFIIPPAVARIGLLVKGLYVIEAPGGILIPLRGVCSDLAIGFLVGVVACLCKRWKAAFWVLWLAWCLLVAFNLDHIRINDANLSYVHLSLLGNRQFLRGCVFSLHHAYHFGLLLVSSGLIAWFLSRLGLVPQLTGKGLAVASACCLSIFFLSTSPLGPNWVQMNLVEENLRRALNPPRKPPVVQAPAPKERQAFFRRDLSGVPLFPYPARPQNILLIILENLSYDTAFSGQMPYFAQLAGRHVSYSNFMSLQRQSNRGLYALMCGDFPNLAGLEAKADILVADQREKCSLPEILASQGFQTLFMEADELGFFQRDRFCRKIGFQKALGEKDYPGTTDHRGWGVADQTFFRQALQEIGLLNKTPRPWFATLFTGGTHYPYTVPGIFSPSKAQALTALDRSLSEFLEGLDQRRLLRNTLVILTADEAVESSGWGIQRELCMNHIPLVVMAPQNRRAIRCEGLFSQRDLLLSICDYLGLAGHGALGRSIFRTYRDSQGVLFGNVYGSKRYAYLAGGKLYAYSILSDQWMAYRVPPGGLFTSSLQYSLPDDHDINMLEKAFAFNEATFAELYLQVLYHQADTAYTGGRKLMGNHRVSCKQGDRLVWQLEMESPEPVELFFSVIFRNIPVSYNNAAPPVVKRVKFPGGKPAVFRYEYTAPRDFDSVNTSIYVQPSGARGYLVKELSLERLLAPAGRQGGAR
jgi:hypothetical protein